MLCVCVMLCCVVCGVHVVSVVWSVVSLWLRCGAVCGVCLVCVCVCVCGVVWHAENPVCTFKTSPCVPAPRAHMFQHVRVVPAYTETF